MDEDRTCTDGPLLQRVKAAELRNTPLPTGGRWERAHYVRAMIGFDAKVTKQRDDACVDDAKKAFALASADNATINLPPTKVLVAPSTDKFFEFAREDNGLLLRVHRCAYLDTSKREPPLMFGETGERVLGTLSARPITPDVAREAVVYLFSTGGMPALSVAESTDDARFVEDFEVGMVTGGDIPDEARTWHVQISVDLATGDVVHTTGPTVAEETASCE